jgi:hypothetical protein
MLPSLFGSRDAVGGARVDGRCLARVACEELRAAGRGSQDRVLGAMVGRRKVGLVGESGRWGSTWCMAHAAVAAAAAVVDDGVRMVVRRLMVLLRYVSQVT